MCWLHWRKSQGLSKVIYTFILWGPSMSIQNFMAINPIVVELFQQSGGSTNQQTDISIHAPKPQAWLKTILTYQLQIHLVRPPLDILLSHSNFLWKGLLASAKNEMNHLHVQLSLTMSSNNKTVHHCS